MSRSVKNGRVEETEMDGRGPILKPVGRHGDGHPKVRLNPSPTTHSRPFHLLVLPMLDYSEGEGPKDCICW